MTRKPVILNPISPVELEILEERVVDEKKDDRELDIKALWQHAGVININNRRYRKELLEREIGKTMNLIQTGESVWGLGFHPGDGLGKPQDISHVWTRVWMNPDGICKGTLTVLPTTLGKEIQVIMKSGRRIGLSSRGFGTTTEKEEMIDGKKTKFLDVNDDYDMKTPGDFVIAPSVLGAGNITEETYKLESKLNEGLDFIVKGESIMEIKTLDELRKAYPELVKQIEDEAKADVVKEKEAKETKVAELEGQIAEKDTKIKELEAEDKNLKEWKEKAIDEIREVISSISEVEGVIPEGTGNDDDNIGNKGNEEIEAELAKAKKALQQSEEKITALETEKQQKEDKEKEAVKEAELQTNLRTKLDETLKKDEYKVYAKLIEAELVKDSKIVIKSVEDVDGAVKAMFEKISNTIAAVEKAKIVASGTREKGHIGNVEGGGTQAEIQAKLEELYQEAAGAGFKGTFNEWKEKYPQIVESIS